MTPTPTRLNEFDKDEWFDVLRRIKPDLSKDEFHNLWGKFQLNKRKKQSS